jgi:TolB-like protein
MDMTTKQDPDSDPERIRACLDRVLASRAFQASPKLQHFLRFVVAAKLADQDARINAYTIGVEVFGRPDDFDPDADAIVRVNASRLRGLLADYYAGPGREDPIRFGLPKGRYLPVFADARGERPSAYGGFRPILLAVERLALIGGPPEQDYLAAGLTDELVTHLSGYGDGMVVVRAPTDGVAREAVASWSGIAFQLRGSLRRDADQVRIGFTLVEAGTDCVAWSETFDFRFSSQGLFEAQEQVARHVASRILDPHGALYRSLKRQPAALLGTCLAVFHYRDYEEHFSPQTHLVARTALEAAVRGARQRLPGRGPVRLQPTAVRIRPDGQVPGRGTPGGRARSAQRHGPLHPGDGPILCQRPRWLSHRRAAGLADGALSSRQPRGYRDAPGPGRSMAAGP